MIWIIIIDGNKQLDGSEEGQQIVKPDAKEAKTIWTDISGKEVKYYKDASWLKEIKKDINENNKHARVQTSHEKIKKILKKIPNWKAPRLDDVQGFWLKDFYQFT